MIVHSQPKHKNKMLVQCQRYCHCVFSRTNTETRFFHPYFDSYHYPLYLLRLTIPGPLPLPPQPLSAPLSQHAHARLTPAEIEPTQTSLFVRGVGVHTSDAALRARFAAFGMHVKYVVVLCFLLLACSRIASGFAMYVVLQYVIFVTVLFSIL